MIESPQDLFEPLDTIDTDDSARKPTQPELLVVKQQPITSSFRRTIKHLSAKGGFRSRFRGVVFYTIYATAFATVAGTLDRFLLRGTAPVFAALLLANFKLAWTHIVISDPSPKPWFRRLPEARVWKKIAGPTAVVAIAQQLSFMIPGYLAVALGLEMNPEAAANMSAHEKHVTAWKGLSIVVLFLALGLFVVMPALISYTRVQASLLADDQESIVPFDRSFGGKVVPAILGGSGIIGLLDAWKTFDWNARVRLAKAYVKVFAMQMTLTFLFLGIGVAELFLIVGKSDLKKIITNPNKDAGMTF
jgi:hypothetical protein